MTTAQPRIILALPAFNEAENLPPLVAAAERTFQGAGFPYQIIVVDDGSTDSTRAVLDAMAAEGRPVRVVPHPENRGLGAAIMTAIRAAVEAAESDDDIVVNMDADNTHDPAYIVPMVEKLAAGCDIVIASRFRGGSREVGVPLVRRLMSRGARLVFRLALRLPEVRDYTCGYRAYRVGLLREALRRYGDALITRRGFACTDELLVKLAGITRRVGEVPFVLRYDQKRGRSKMPLLRTIWETLRLLVLHR